MSGFEIVGVVLGGIPLIISALEHYAQGISIIMRYKHHARVLRSYQTKLKIQQALLHGTVKRLLSLSGFSVAESNTHLLSSELEEISTLWGNKDIEKKLRGKLGSTLDILMNVIKEAGIPWR